MSKDNEPTDTELMQREEELSNEEESRNEGRAAEETTKFDTVEQEQAMKEVDSIFGSLIQLRRLRWTGRELREMNKQVIQTVLTKYSPQREQDISHGVSLNDDGFPIFEND